MVARTKNQRCDGILVVDREKKRKKSEKNQRMNMKSERMSGWLDDVEGWGNNQSEQPNICCPPACPLSPGLRSTWNVKSIFIWLVFSLFVVYGQAGSVCERRDVVLSPLSLMVFVYYLDFVMYCLSWVICFLLKLCVLVKQHARNGNPFTSAFDMTWTRGSVEPCLAMPMHIYMAECYRNWFIRGDIRSDLMPSSLVVWTPKVVCHSIHRRPLTLPKSRMHCLYVPKA